MDRFLTLRRDVPTAISVLVTFFILLFMTLVSWFRILILAHTNPGYVPKGPNFYKAKSVEAAHAYYSDNMEKLLSFEGGLVRGFTLTRLLQFNGAAPEARARQASQEMPSTKPAEDDLKNLDYMLGNRNTFVCNSDGRLGWCEECYNWKPERAHHCSDTGRCVLRMDHVSTHSVGPLYTPLVDTALPVLPLDFRCRQCYHVQVLHSVHLLQLPPLLLFPRHYSRGNHLLILHKPSSHRPHCSCRLLRLLHSCAVWERSPPCVSQYHGRRMGV